MHDKYILIICIIGEHVIITILGFQSTDYIVFDREDALAVLGIALMFKTEFAKSTIICIFLVYKWFQES